jgi:hypothetical protein
MHLDNVPIGLIPTRKETRGTAWRDRERATFHVGCVPSAARVVLIMDRKRQFVVSATLFTSHANFGPITCNNVPRPFFLTDLAMHPWTQWTPEIEISVAWNEQAHGKELTLKTLNSIPVCIV